MATILSPSPANLRRVAAVLKRGGLVAIPTETVYGLAADALNARACRAIFRAKDRPLADPLIVHVPNATAAASIAAIPPVARRLMRAFWPGPLTLVLQKRALVPDLITAGGPTVAVRCPDHPITQRLLRLCGRPLAAPSANPFGRLSPTTAEHVAHGLGRKIRFIVDGGPCRVGIESTIVDVSNPERPRILRVGGIAATALARVLHAAAPVANQAAKRGAILPAPGLLARHYSPHTPLRIHRKITKALVRAAGANAGFLFFAPSPAASASAAGGTHVQILSRRASPTEAARRLFACLHALDRGGFRVIHAEWAPAGDAGAAINDRLRRAAAARGARKPVARKA
jgi:L-threonylcarbamoyladenylate synthase